MSSTFLQQNLVWSQMHKNAADSPNCVCAKGQKNVPTYFLGGLAGTNLQQEFIYIGPKLTLWTVLLVSVYAKSKALWDCVAAIFFKFWK